MKALFQIVLLMSCALPLAAEEARGREIVVKDAWVRATVVGQKVTALYLRVESAAAATLVGIGVSPLVAGQTEVHETVRDKDMARMQRVERIPIDAGEALDFTPGGYHAMLIDLRRQLKAGESVPVTLSFSQAGKTRQIAIKAIVRPIDAAIDHSATHGMHGAAGDAK